MRFMTGDNNGTSMLLIYDMIIPIVVMVIGSILIRFVCKTGSKLADFDHDRISMANPMSRKQSRV